MSTKREQRKTERKTERKRVLGRREHVIDVQIDRGDMSETDMISCETQAAER